MIAPAAAAQDSGALYYGIDLTADPEPVEDMRPRSVDATMRGLLDEGVELGCLTFEPPATFAQTDNLSAECVDFTARIASVSAPPPQPSEHALAELAGHPLRAVPLVILAQATQRGDKPSLLELGMRFEEGVAGVERNWDYAAELYREAGRATPARRGIVLRQSGDDAMGAPGGASAQRGVISPRVPGLPEARERLAALEARIEAAEE